jgi:polysaccharide biosynthesis/export protein
MQPVRCGAARWCLWAGVGLSALLSPAWLPAQSTVETTQQQTNERIKTLSVSVASGPHEYVVGNGDLLGVEVFDIPELTRDLRVSQTGTIGLPLVPVRLFVAGLSEMQVQQKISEVLEANGLVSHPQVIVSVKEKKSKPITIVGAVIHPMVYQADRPVTLIEVLAEAGGITPDAGDVVIVTRQNAHPQTASNEPPEIGADAVTPIGNPAAAGAAAKPEPSVANEPAAAPAPVFPTAEPAAKDALPETKSVPPPITDADAAPLPNTITVNLAELIEHGNIQNNIPLQSGDVITIPHAGIVYALGAVQKPGGFVSTGDRSQLSTLKLLALAGGFSRVAKRDRAVIIRTDAMGKQQTIPVDMGKIVNRKSEDVRLIPSDILYIPDNSAKAALIRAGEIGIAIGSALAIYRLGTGR